jgi:predicted helicase
VSTKAGQLHYAAITGEYEEFSNLCFVDTLDNVAGLRKHAGHIDDLFGGVTDVNIKRIREQNSRKISVIIGNPPYNANQLNENENNKNREYPEIDKRIKETYIEASTAQKTKLYDMYARFFRWASDRLDANGVLALITNRSFLDSRTFDGFRSVVADEFHDIYVVDLGGDVRTNPRLSGTRNNVFGIQTGVAISFMVKRAKGRGCQVHYVRRPEMESADEKLSFLSSNKLSQLTLEAVAPSPRHDWLNVRQSDFETFVALVSKETKRGRQSKGATAIFKSFSFGIVTNRDDWVYARNRNEVEKRAQYLIESYNRDVTLSQSKGGARTIVPTATTDIKWTRSVKKDLAAGKRYAFDESLICEAAYRPFTNRFLYFSSDLNEMQNLMRRYFGAKGKERTRALVFTDPTSQKPFMSLSIDRCPDMHLVGAAAGSVTVPLALTTELGDQEDNITDWSLDQFRKHYQPGRGKKDRPITKEAIFHYVYAVLHDPVYREKYALNLKREFPRIPFYQDFWQWADWGRTLMDLHIGYEQVERWKLKRTDVPDEKAKQAGQAPKAILKADKETGRIRLDSETTLEGVPPEAWDYRLGNRSALEWILDQYKESKPKDPTIREKFDTYRFADYKEKVIDLLARVTTVSVETQRIVEAMGKTPH